MLKKLNQIFFDQSEHLFLWVPVLFATGIGLYFLSPFNVPSFILVLLIELMILLVYFERHNRGLMLILTALLIVFSGFSYIKLYTIHQSKHVLFVDNDETIYLKGRIQKIDNTAKGKTRLWLSQVSDFDKPRLGIYRLSVDQNTGFEIGSCIEAAANITKPSYPLKPDGFEFDRFAFYQGISGVGYALSHVYEIDCQTTPPWYIRILNDINQSRKNISAYILRILPKDEASIASAILVGDKNQLTSSQYTQYRNAGLAHFLAISGLHLGLVAAFAFFVVRLLMASIPFLALKYNSKTAASILAIALSLIYLLLSGANVPAIRAFLMTSIVFLGFIYDRNAISMRMAAFAALVIMISEPYIILSAGFQMSFAAVTALIAFYEFLSQNNILKTKRGLFLTIFYYFIGVILTSLIATLATLPFTLYHFGTFSPYTLLGNVIAAPLIAFIIMPFIFLSLILLPLHLSALPLYISGFGIGLLNDLTAFISKLPFSDLILPQLPFSGLILITFGGLWLCLWQKKWRLLGIIPIIAGLITYAFIKEANILYSSDGQTIGIQKSEDEWLIFSPKKNSFLFNIIANGKHFKHFKTLQNNEQIGLICDEKQCIYQNVFSFDLKGSISLNGLKIDSKQTLGGQIYLKSGHTEHKTVRQSIGFRPWNTTN